MSLKILMVFGTIRPDGLLFSIFSLFPDFKKIFFCFLLIFMLNAFFKNLLILCCLSMFQNRGLELMWSSLTVMGQCLPGCAIRGWGWSWAFSWAESNMYINSFFKNIFISLFVWLRRVFVVARGIFSCGMRELVPWPQGSNPGPLRWERRILTTGPPGKVPHFCICQEYANNSREVGRQLSL